MKFLFAAAAVLAVAISATGGVAFEISAKRVPDNGGTILLMSLGLLGLAAFAAGKATVAAPCLARNRSKN